MSTKIDHAGLARMVEFFKACNYSIQEVVDYCWECYGRNAAIVDANYEATDRGVFGIVASAQMIINRRTHEVYEISVCDTRAGKEFAFKWHNPTYSLAHDLESARRGIPAAEVDQAWDKVNYKRTTDRSVLSRIKLLFNPPIKKRKPKKKASTASRKLVQASKRKKVTGRRR
jgi:phage tail protein X